jgi:phosphoadenosine phosphosulfate reductase
MSILFQPIKTARCISDNVIVGFSGGKDSICALDLCCRYFGTVHAYFMYLVPGLSFQEAQLRWYEQRHNLKIHRVPHPMLSSWLKWGVFRKSDFYVPEISFANITTALRESQRSSVVG